MKKIILAITTILIIGVACNKAKTTIESIDNTTTKHTRSNEVDVYKTEFGFLKFRNRETYDSVLDHIKDLSKDELNKWTDQLQFYPLQRKLENGRTSNQDKLGLEDAVLLTILDSNCMIQIGDYIYRIDEPKAQIWTIAYSSSQTLIKAFFNKQFNSASMNVLNFDYQYNEMDIIEFVEAGNVGVKQQSTRGWTPFGLDSKPAPVIFDLGPGTIQNKGDAKTVYQAVGIYFSLYTELKTYKKSAGGNIWTPMSTNICLNNWDWGNSTATYTPKNKPQVNKTQSSCNNGYHHDWRPYSASRKLTSALIYGRFKFEAGWGNYWAQHNTGLNF